MYRRMHRKKKHYKTLKDENEAFKQKLLELLDPKFELFGEKLRVSNPFLEKQIHKISETILNKCEEEPIFKAFLVKCLIVIIKHSIEKKLICIQSILF